MTWEVRAVTETGALVAVVDGVNVDRVFLGINGDEYAELTIPTLHPSTVDLDLFGNELQFWLDGTLELWGRPVRMDANRSGSQDGLRVRSDGLFSYFFDELIGGEKVNHIVSPHEDLAAVGTLPNSWEASSAVELHAVVDNNWEFWHAQKAIQVNNSATGTDAYIWQRFVVPAELDRVPFSAAATCYISDNQGGSPAWGGPALNERGLMIHRLDGVTFAPIAGVRSAKITEDTPRNALVRLQTKELLPRAGEVIEVRLYAPDAWTAWRWVGLFDGRWEGSDGQSKNAAVQLLVNHAQDTLVGKQDHNIGTDVTALGETTNKTWPWWRRDNIGEQIVELADTFEFTMDYPTLTPGAAVRNLKARQTLGTDRSATVTLTKVDLVAWGLSTELATSFSRIIRQGDGQGIARDEWWEDNLAGLGGAVREGLRFASPGETLAQLRDQALAELARVASVAKIPSATVVGALAALIRPGDRIAVNLNHGWAQYVGDARALAVELDSAGRATLHLEPVT